MLKRLFFILCAFVLIGSSALHGQEDRVTINYDLTKRPISDQVINVAYSNYGITSFKKEQDALFFSIPMTVRMSHSTPFLAFSIQGNFSNFDTSNASLFVRFGSTLESLGDYEKVQAYHHEELSDTSFTSELMFVEAKDTIFQFLLLFKRTYPGGVTPKASKLSFDFFAPGHSLPVNTASNPLSQSLLGTDPDCDCSVPAFANRTSWGAPPGQSYSTDPSKNPSYSAVSHLIVHHSAGSNSSSDWPATVLSIWNFHVNSRGWDDIGYNWLIDPNGQIYEGRGGGNDVVGAHFCGKNTGTMGICMLGTFENQAPTAKAIGSLNKLLAWKLCDANLDAYDTTQLGSTGLNIPVISGHKNGCATLCPGSVLFQDLPNIRQSAQLAYDNCQMATDVEQEELAEVKIFPNPSQGKAWLEWTQASPATAKVRVFDHRGRQVYGREGFYGTGQMRLPLELSSLGEGIYSIQIHTPFIHISKKMLIKR